VTRRVLAAAGAAAAIAALTPGVAGAATRTVFAGGDGVVRNAPAQFSPNAFLRRTIIVHKGDTVRWQFRGFHTVTVPPKGDNPPPFAQATADKVSGALDAAGRPFWFNGVLPTLVVNPRAAAPTKGTAYTGSSFRNSGLPALPNAKPYSLRFTKTGTFTYFCAVHPGMVGRVRVVSSQTRVPTNAQNRAAGARELNRLAAQARVTAARPPRSPTIVDLGRAPHDRRFTINAFFPSAITARVGQVIEFSMAGQNPNEIHTVTFGSAQTRAQVPFVTQTGAINPIAAYRSEPPDAPLIITGTNHGNGFLNAGVLDADRATPTTRNFTRVAFSKPGSYHVLCLIHEGMEATVTVTP